MHLNEILAQAAAPQSGQQQQPTGFQALFGNSIIFPMVLMLVVMYFLLFRPQQQQRTRHAVLLKNLKSGDKVVTAGGIVGIVITVKDSTVSLRSADAKMEITKSSVAEIIESGGTTES
jgi:preprotein translocase subunit YajC